MAGLIAGTYARALFELGKEKGNLSLLETEAELLAKAIRENPGFLELLGDPSLGEGKKLKFLDRCLKGRFSEEMTGLFAVALRKGRGRELERILEDFLFRAREYRGEGRAEVATAMELDDAGKKRVEEKLLSTTGYKTMKIQYRVDRSLIAGMVVQVGGKVVDNTVKHRIEELKSRLLKVSLEEEKVGERGV